MKINDTGTARAAQAYGSIRRTDRRAAPTATAGPAGPAKTDRATLSPEAQALMKSNKAGSTGETSRTELVEQLRRQVQDGTYKVDEQALARRLAQQLAVSDPEA